MPKEGLASAPPIDVPRTFGRLMLLKLIARGGMGDVFLAATTGIEGAERPCVVKTVRRDHIHDGSFLARFLDEARVQSQLNHPGVAQVLEASTDENGEPYTVVEYVEGRSLADARQRSINMGARVGWPEAIALAIEMAQALAHVHERAGADGTPLGVVHRDLSPQNVMVAYSGEVKLIDFGTARGHNRRCHTVAGVVFAKPGYVAPEVARQEVGDGRIDIYALGIMVWELCAGRRYLANDPQKHLEEAAAGVLTLPPIAKQVGAPEALDAVLAKLTENDPDLRYTSASAAADDLARVLAQAPAGKNGERSVRGRIASLMTILWPNEPARSRAEFVKLLRDARLLRKVEATPSASDMMQQQAEHMLDAGGLLAGTSYRLLEKIGEGASGTVWKAEHTELGRQVAIKLLAPEHAAATDAIDRFRREARAIAALSHPNLVQLYDFGKANDGRVFLAMEALDGMTLETLAASARMPWKRTLEIAIQATRALEAAHAAGLVHRDLKPQNLFVTHAGVVKLLDFGVAMALSDTTTDEKRQKGFAIFGTPEYMAPEQVEGTAVDARCDLYALGCVLYELVCGERPYSGSSVEVLGKQLREPVTPPSSRDASVPSHVEAIILRALEKDRSKRFADAGEMRRALEEALDFVAPAPTKAKRTLSPKMRTALKRGALLVGAAVAIVVVTKAGSMASPRPEVTVEVEPPVREVDVAPVVPIVPTADVPSPVSVTPPVVIPAVPNDKRPRVNNGLTVARDRAMKQPTDVHALKGWAQAALKAGDLKEARHAADAWALHDASADPELFLAVVLDASGKRGEARAVLDEILEAHPDSTEARKLQARLGKNEVAKR